MRNCSSQQTEETSGLDAAMLLEFLNLAINIVVAELFMEGRNQPEPLNKIWRNI